MRCSSPLITFMSILLLAVSSLADTTWVSAGNVSGVWPPANSPYIVYQGDIRVQSGDTLVILPGTEVKFTGRYKFIVNGLLTADGTISDSLLFSRAYPTEESKWRGFRFEGADSHSSIFYARIEYARGDGAYPEVRGGAIRIMNGSVTVRHCLIAHNYSANANLNGGGAAICIDQNGTALVHYNVIADNEGDSGGGILVMTDSLPNIGFNIFENNRAFSGGGGIYVGAGSQAEIFNNIFRGNSSAGWGGGAVNLWSATWLYGTFSLVQKNIMHHNSAVNAGGAIYSRYDGSLIHSNTIADNQASQGGGIYVLNQGSDPPSISNSIIWGNTAGTGANVSLEQSTGSAAVFSYCDIQGGWPGSGNIDADPLFSAGPSGNYYLSQTASGQAVQSPCVDAGNPQTVMFYGTTRTDHVQDSGIVDLGYHYNLVQLVTLRLVMTPQNPPIRIPPGGGNFSFEARVTNYSAGAITFDAWTLAILPNGSVYGPVMLRQDLTIGGGISISRLLTQAVPANAPAGNYTLIGRVGVYPNTITATDGIQFMKLGGE